MVIGPGEFWADEGKTPSTDGELDKSLLAPQNFLRAYERFNAQGIYVSPRAQAWLGDKVKTLPAYFLLLKQAPLTRIVFIAGSKVALVFLPPTDKIAPGEMSEEYKAALSAGRTAAQEAALVIAVSPWGSELERAFAGEAEGIFHIILGGGPGYGFASSAVGELEGVLWTRPENQGRSVNVIEILAWPSPAAHRWEYGITYEAYTKLLSPNIPPDPVIMEIFPDRK